jgi:hypothetical protein
MQVGVQKNKSTAVKEQKLLNLKFLRWQRCQTSQAKLVLRFFVESQVAEFQVTERHIVEIC